MNAGPPKKNLTAVPGTILRCLLVLAFLLSAVCSARPALGQTAPTAEQWIEDVRFLQELIHDEYDTLFRKITREEFDQHVEEFVSEIPDMKPHEIVVGVARLVSLFQYGHTQAAMSESPVPYHRLPIHLYEFSDGLFIQGAHQELKDLLGARLVAVEGMPVDEALKKVRPVVPAENDQYMKAYGPAYLCIPEVLHAQGIIPELKTEIELTLEAGGKELTRTISAGPSSNRPPLVHGFPQQTGEWLEARDQQETPLYLKNLDQIYFFEYLPDSKTVYVRHSAIQDQPDEPIPAFYQRLFEFVDANDVERLVIDLRLNGGGNNYKNKPIVTGIIECEKINRTGHLYVIIGRRTFSACQNLVNELDNYTKAIFVGEPTSENINFLGDSNRVLLPNSQMPVYLSFAWWQDKPQWENRDWLAPDLAVELSYDDYRSNRDPVLQAALETDADTFIADPIAYLREMFMSGERERVVSETKRLITDQRYRFVNFEGMLNNGGYELLNADRPQDAIFVFKLVTELFPESPNAWDSLAEGHLRAGEREEAVRLYEKAIELDDENGPTAANAREMLKQIKSEQTGEDSQP